jgi:hypothetical protein
MRAAACGLLATSFISMILSKSYRKETLFPFLLWTLLLLLYFSNMLWNSVYALTAATPLQYPISLLELLLHGWIARLVLPSTKRHFMDYLLIALTSISLTFFFTAQYPKENGILSTLHIIISGGMSVLIIAAGMQQKNLNILQSPLFWMSVGTLFYTTMYLLITFVASSLPWTTDTPQEIELLLLFFNLVRFILYLVATLVKEPTGNEA